MTIERIEVKCFKIPTETPEKDGTLEWDSTSLVTVELYSKGKKGLGYTYADRSTAEFIVEHTFPLLLGAEVRNYAAVFDQIKKTNRNMGNAGISSMALSAIDIALWDLKAHRLDISIQDFFGKRRSAVSFYGSGLFLNNTVEELAHQVKKFKEHGLKNFKMKIGRTPEKDIERVQLVKGLMEAEERIYVDANGSYHPKEALQLAFDLEKEGIQWFEEPISPDDVSGMAWLRKEFPSKVKLVSGEYCYQDTDVLRLLQNQAVDIVMVDGTRCEGVTGLLRAAHLAHAYHVPLSTHCAPLLHGNIGPCLENLQESECFYDHLRIEEEYLEFDGEFVDGKFFAAEDQIGFGWRIRPATKEFMVYEHASA